MSARMSLGCPPTNPELIRLLEAAKLRGPLTPREIWQQRVSWAYGNNLSDNAPTREQVEAAAIAVYGPCPE